MMQRIPSCILMLSLIFSLSACQSDKASSEKNTGEMETTSVGVDDTEQYTSSETGSAVSMNWPSIEDDFWNVYDTRCDMTYYGYFSRWNVLEFTMVSASPLQEENVQVSSADGWTFTAYLDPYNPYIAEDGEWRLYEDIFLLYQGVTAEEQDAFNNGKLTQQRSGEIREFLNAYRALDEGNIPVLYKYILHLSCEEPSDDPAAALTEIDVTVNGTTKNFSVGNVSTVYDERGYQNDVGFNLNCNDNISFLGHGVVISSVGTIEFRDIKYTAVSDLTITGLSFYQNDEIVIQNVSVKQEIEEDFLVDIAWDGKEPLELSEGDVIYLTVIATDPWFAGTAGGWAARYLMVEYEYNEETYGLGIPFYCQQSLGDAFAYVALDAGYDVLPLYYLNN